MPFRWLGMLLATALSIAVAGCGTDAVGVEACKQIEEARCQQAPACNIALEPPYHTNGSDVTECVRFYNDACLHGLASGSDPGPTAVKQCVAAIQQGNCSVVVNPSVTTACAWLTPSASTSDASVESSSIPGDGAALDVATQ